MPPTSKVGLSRQHPGLGNAIFHGNRGCPLNNCNRISQVMKTCKSCGRVRFFSINFIFSKSICNECYLVIKSQNELHDRSG
jgi:hypothetical protein